MAPSALTVFAPVRRQSGAVTVAVKRPCPLVRMVVGASASPLSASVSSSLGPKPLPEMRTRSPACALVGTSARRGALVAALVAVGVRVGATVGVLVGVLAGRLVLVGVLGTPYVNWSAGVTGVVITLVPTSAATATSTVPAA